MLFDCGLSTCSDADSESSVWKDILYRKRQRCI